MTREEAYETVAKIAAEHALIAQGFGGILTIVHPETQRAEGLEELCLYMAGQGPHPAALKQQQQTTQPEPPAADHDQMPLL